MNRAYVDMNFYTELSDLEKIIHTRFLMLPSENKNNSNFIKCLKLIQEELFNSFPIFDNNFYLTYNKIISELKEKIVLNQKKILENELSFSSELHLSYLSDMINSKSFWEKDELDVIKKSHLHFLKEEFFAIVHDLAQENQFAEIFVDNNQVLENQILKDKDRTEAIFEIVEERMKLKMPRKVNAQKGTNYTIRERENEREVKVRIESGRKLEELIEQDF